MAVVTDLVTQFSFKGSTAPLKNFIGSIQSATQLLFGFDVGLVDIAKSIKNMTQEVFSSLDPLAQMQRETGVSIERIQELGFIASQSGSDINAITSTITNLSGKIAEASLKGSEDFARLGISIRDASGEVKNADVVLEEVRKRFQEMNLTLQQQNTLASSLGIDSSLLQLLDTTDEQMASLTDRARQLGVVSAEQAEQLIEVNDTFAALGYGVESLKRQIALGLGPEMKEITSAFTDFLVENQDLIKNGIKVTISFLKDLVQEIAKLVPAITIVVGIFVAFKIAAVGLTGVMGVLLSPVVLITAAIAALVLVVDDLLAYFRGGESVIGNFIESLMEIEEVKAAYESVAEFVKELGEAFSYFGNIIAEQFADDTVLGQMLNSFMELEAVKFVFDGIKDAASGAFSVIKKISESIGSLVSSIFDNSLVKKFFGFGDKDASLNVSEKTVLPPGGIDNPSIRQAVSNSNSQSDDNRSYNMKQENTINIQSTNAQDAQRGVENALYRQNEDAVNQFKRGGL